MMHRDRTHENALRGDNVAAFSVVEAGLRDMRQVRRIQEASFRPGLAYGMFPLVTLQLMPFVTFLVAKSDASGEVIGCIIGDYHRGDVRIMNIAVHPDWRRLGVARALLHAIGKRLPKGNIVLMVEEPNHGAQALYESEGYTRSGYHRGYYGAHRNGIEMTLRRQPAAPMRDGKPAAGRIRVP